jgi:hypothetical protein
MVRKQRKSSRFFSRFWHSSCSNYFGLKCNRKYSFSPVIYAIVAAIRQLAAAARQTKLQRCIITP